MFTGIVSGVGSIIRSDNLGASATFGKRLTIQTPADYLLDVALGDSIALNGACMTVATLSESTNQFTVDISAESLSKTAGLDRTAQRINLEKALRAHDRLGGHIVSGHVDDVGVVTHFSVLGESWQLRVLCPGALAKFLAVKGSVTINGVSLTINHVQDASHGCEISINLIPHTLENTALGSLKQGAPVNVEIDLIARYVARMREPRI